MNQMRFGTREFDFDKKVTEEQKFVYVPMNSQLREEMVFKV